MNCKFTVKRLLTPGFGIGWVTIAFLLLVLAGCSADSNQVTGRVTLDNEPLADAIVQFIPESDGGRIAIGRTDSNGVYRLKSSRNITDVSPGKYVVEITTSDLVESDDGEEKFSAELVPKKFNRNSNVIKEIKEGFNEIDFDIASE